MADLDNRRELGSESDLKLGQTEHWVRSHSGHSMRTDNAVIRDEEQDSIKSVGKSTSLPKSTSSYEDHEGESQILEPGDSDTENDDYWKYIPLYQAALQGDWLTAKAFFDQCQDALTAEINEFSETALHVAAGAARSSKSLEFVQNLVDKISTEALEHRDQFGRTALHLAAWVGNTEAAKVLLQKHISLLYIRDSNNMSALDMAAKSAMQDTLLCLLDHFDKLVPDEDSDAQFPFAKLFPDDDSAAQFLILVISYGYYDLALCLVEKYPLFATSKQEDGDCGLKAIARKDSAFKSGKDYHWWQRIVYALSRGDIENAADKPQVKRLKYEGALLFVKSFIAFDVTRTIYNWAGHLLEYICTFVPCIKNIHDQKKMHLQALKLVKCLCAEVRSLNDSDAYYFHAKDALLTAAKLGIHEVIEEIVESFPTLLWAKDEENLNVLQIAVVERHANVFNLIYQMGGFQQVLVQTNDNFGNNLLHLAGKLAPQNKMNLVIGAAQQMQRELQWFEEVKKFANPRDIDCRNNANETPKMVFTREHELLRAEGEKWMKRTANSCTIPAALVVTVVFVAAIVVPVWINGRDGIPIISKELPFFIFVIFNAISLFVSITSLLVFLSILDSRFTQSDFLSALPKRLIIGLVTLFLSIATMVVAFSFALYIMFGNETKARILYPLVALGLMPVISFAFLQFPLLLDLIKSTYFPLIFGKQSTRMFY